MTALCADEDLLELSGLIEQDEAAGLARLAHLIDAHPDDPRLLFLDGSLCAARRDYGAARVAMERAVSLNPDYAIARFQLGLLLLTEGEAEAARATWRPLLSLPDENPLRLFGTGLDYLIDDRWAETLDWLERGVRQNHANPALNQDMERIMREVRARIAPPDAGAGADEPVSSAAQLLLQQAAIRSTKH